MNMSLIFEIMEMAFNCLPKHLNLDLDRRTQNNKLKLWIKVSVAVVVGFNSHPNANEDIWLLVNWSGEKVSFAESEWKASQNTNINNSMSWLVVGGKRMSKVLYYLWKQYTSLKSYRACYRAHIWLIVGCWMLTLLLLHTFGSQCAGGNRLTHIHWWVFVVWVWLWLWFHLDVGYHFPPDGKWCEGWRQVTNGNKTEKQ